MQCQCGGRHISSALISIAERWSALPSSHRALRMFKPPPPSCHVVRDSVDIVTAFEALKHIPKGAKRQMLHDIRGVLRSG